MDGQGEPLRIEGRVEEVGQLPVHLGPPVDVRPLLLIYLEALGKQLLGQQDKYELALSHVDNETFVAEAQRRLIDATKSSGNS